MKEEFKPLKLMKNEAKHRFEMEVDNLQTFIDYKERNDKIFLIHTEDPEELEGRGVATAIIEKALTHIEDKGYKLVALCPMVVAYIRRHPEWKRILALQQNDII
ncbi:N-acetyltransferase [Olivibacter sp. SDN3]|uniref:GNAT family N-acetyltransferase n=1 Tax=Olivibacter sp. SDN3 TaxID=2764720 RepID=UPI0016514063|nr:GNAT family N-acetyltransferase [Olivibacter sp. SDN3]QNL48291.1 N-acetyltransferase [Olivibacter sp. SDN3]